MTKDLGALSGSRASMEPVISLHPPGFDPAREKSAFMAGWLTRHHRSDVQPEEAWLTYLDSQEGTRE